MQPSANHTVNKGVRLPQKYMDVICEEARVSGIGRSSVVLRVLLLARIAAGNLDVLARLMDDRSLLLAGHSITARVTINFTVENMALIKDTLLIVKQHTRPSTEVGFTQLLHAVLIEHINHPAPGWGH